MEPRWENMRPLYGKLDPSTWEKSDLLIYADYSPTLFVVADYSDIPSPQGQAVGLSNLDVTQRGEPPFFALFPFADVEFIDSVSGMWVNFFNGYFQEQGDVGNRYADLTEYTAVREYDHSGDNLKYLAGFVLAGVAIGAIVYSAPILSAIAGFVGKVGSVIGDTWEKIAPLRELISKKIEAAKAVYVRVAETIHLDELLVLERIADLTWKEYSDLKTAFLQRVGVFSQELFGDMHVINQYLSLAGMMFQDWALLAGYTWDEQEIIWLSKSAEFLRKAEDSIEIYAIRPEQLWFDLEREIVKPIYEARAATLTATEEGRQAISGVAEELREDYSYLDRRLREYQMALPNNVRDILGDGLTKLRKDLREVWNNDLKGVLDGIVYVASLDADRVRTVEEAQKATAITTKRNEMLLADPVKLDPVEAGEQREVHGRIQNSLADRLRAFTLEVNELVTPGYGKKLQEVWEVE